MSWVVVANQAGASVYQKNPKGDLRLLERITNPMGRERNKSMRHDKPGMSRAKFKNNSAPHALTGKKNPHFEVEDQFARQLAEHFYKAFLAKDFFEIEFFAAPRLLGKIRRFTEKSLKQVATWTPKDIEKTTSARRLSAS